MYDNRGVWYKISKLCIMCYFSHYNQELVWSGAAVFENRISFDFTAIQINGTSHLSLILAANGERDLDLKGAGVIMDTHYQIQQKVHMRDSPIFNMHEFNVIEADHSALAITLIPTWHSVESLHAMSSYAWVANNGFQEIDLRTNEVLFDWHSLDHVDVSASQLPVGGGMDAQDTWDWL
jgi:hypothetical protein